MEAKAIQLIQDTAVLAFAKPLDTFTPALVLPSDQKIHSIEKFQAGRSRFRGALTTHSLLDFGNYVMTQSPEVVASGFVDAEAMSCTVIFNLGDTKSPGHGDFTATLNLRKLLRSGRWSVQLLFSSRRKTSATGSRIGRRISKPSRPMTVPSICVKPRAPSAPSASSKHARANTSSAT